MDLLDNVATELGFEFHLYVVRDQLFGAKKPRTIQDHLANGKQSVNHQPPPTTHTTDYKSWSTDGRHQINPADTDNREYTENVNEQHSDASVFVLRQFASILPHGNGTKPFENLFSRWMH